MPRLCCHMRSVFVGRNVRQNVLLFGRMFYCSAESSLFGIILVGLTWLCTIPLPYWRYFAPPFGNDPFVGSAFQASLDLSKTRNPQMDHFALIRYVEISEIVRITILLDIPPFRGQRISRFLNLIWVCQIVWKLGFILLI